MNEIIKDCIVVVMNHQSTEDFFGSNIPCWVLGL